VPSYGGGTFAAFFLSWAIPRFAFMGLDYVLGKPPLLQRQFTPAMRRKAWFWVCVNWVAVVLPILAASSPLLRRLFPEEAEWPVWWQVAVLFVASMCSHDVICMIDANSVRLLQRWRLSDVPPLLSGPLAWGGYYVQPAELLLQALDSIVGPAVWSVFVAPLPVTAWWSWAATMQVLWVIDRSHYALPSPSNLLAQLMPEEKKKHGRKGGKPSVKEIAQKRNR